MMYFDVPKRTKKKYKKENKKKIIKDTSFFMYLDKKYLALKSNVTKLLFEWDEISNIITISSKTLVKTITLFHFVEVDFKYSGQLTRSHNQLQFIDKKKEDLEI